MKLITTSSFILFLFVVFTSSTQLFAQEIQSKMLSESIKSDALLYHESGVVYCSGGWNGSTNYKILPDGEIVVHADGLTGIVDMVWGENDTIIGSSYQTGWLKKIAPDGTTSFFVYVGTGVGSLYKDYNGDIICAINPGLAHPSPGSVKRVTPEGNVSNFASGGSIHKPGGITQDVEGNYYISNLGDGRITKISVDGTQELFASVPATGKWKIGYIKFWKGAFYTSAISENKIYKTTLTGDVSVFAGSGAYENLDGELLRAGIKEPNGMAVSGDTLFILSGINLTDRIRFITDISTDLDKDSFGSSFNYLLNTNYPNPFNPSTTISYSLAQRSYVTLDVYNIQGEKVESVVNAIQNTGEYNVQFDGSNLASGIYIARLRASSEGEIDFTKSIKMILMK